MLDRNVIVDQQRVELTGDLVGRLLEVGADLGDGLHRLECAGARGCGADGPHSILRLLVQALERGVVGFFFQQPAGTPGPSQRSVGHGEEAARPWARSETSIPRRSGVARFSAWVLGWSTSNQPSVRPSYP